MTQARPPLVQVRSSMKNPTLDMQLLCHLRIVDAIGELKNSLQFYTKQQT